MSIHRIRLAGPWQFRIANGPASAEWQTVRLPSPESWPGDSADCILMRKFHSPTGIDNSTPLWISLAITNCDPTVLLNGQPLVAELSEATDASVDHDRYLCDVMGKLRPFNELQVQLTRRNQAVAASVAGSVEACLDGFLTAVALEIQSS